MTLPEVGEYRLHLRGAASKNDLIVQSKLLLEKKFSELESDPASLGFYDKRMVFMSSRKPLDISTYSAAELGKLIPSDIVVINSKYQYFDLGTVSGAKCQYAIYFDKQDDAPLVVEGLLLINESEYQSLELPSNVQAVQEKDLCCGPVIIEGQQP